MTKDEFVDISGLNPDEWVKEIPISSLALQSNGTQFLNKYTDELFISDLSVKIRRRRTKLISTRFLNYKVISDTKFRFRRGSTAVHYALGGIRDPRPGDTVFAINKDLKNIIETKIKNISSGIVELEDPITGSNLTLCYRLQEYDTLKPGQTVEVFDNDDSVLVFKDFDPRPFLFHLSIKDIVSIAANRAGRFYWTL